MLSISNQLPPPQPGKQGWPWEVDRYPEVSELPAHTSWPKLSVITPSFNQVEYIEETIRSVLLQGYPNLEYIVIDGGSKDGSVDIIRKYEPWLAYWVSEPDHGQSDAINKGFSHATGDWLSWINSDDLYLPATLDHIAATVINDPEAAWIVGGIIYTDSHLNEQDHIAPRVRSEAFNRKPDYLVGTWLDFVCTRNSGTFLPQPSSFWKKTVCEIAGPINTNFHYSMDAEYYARLAYYGYTPVTVDEPLAIFRKHQTQKTYQGRVKFLREETTIVDIWIPQVSSTERRVLIKYRSWLRSFIFRTQVKEYLTRFGLYDFYLKIRRFNPARVNASH